MNENLITALKPEPQSVFFRCVEDCNDTVMISDSKGRIIYTNPAWQKLYGFEPSESLGKTARLLHSGWHDQKFYKEMWTSIGNPKNGYWRGEVVNKSKKETLLTVLLTITPFKGPKGEVLGYMGIATDLTAQKVLERKLKIREHLSVLRHFSERLAHEIGTTLAVVRGRAELLLQRLDDPIQMRDGIGIILGQSDRITKLIGYLLKFSRSTNAPHAEKIELHAKVEKALKSVEAKAQKSLIDLEINISEDLAVLGDRKRLFESIASLIENAIEAIEHSIQKGRAQDHKISLRGYRDHSNVILEIRDTGGGISRENLVKVFQPFFTTKDIGKGTGMGLTMASRFIEDMGGEISLESEGESAVFKVTLPKAV
ncbi:MAG: two-component system sensor histidine kinase NtrB [Bdellovibrionota bacterium]